MSNNNYESSDPVILKGVRLDYFDIFTPGEPQDEDKKADKSQWKYGARAIFDRDSDAFRAASAAFMAAATKMWGANAPAMVQSFAKNQKALRNGDHERTKDGAPKPDYIGKMFVSAKNKDKPAIVAQAKHNGDFITIGEDGLGYQNGMALTPPPYPITKPYRGCIVNLKLQFIAGKANGKVSNQVYAKFIAIQFVRDDVPFAGAGPMTAEGFEDEAAPVIASNAPAGTIVTGGASDLF